MNQDKFAQSLQEDLLSLLVHSDEHGKVIARTIPANLFEGDYRHIASKALDFWTQYNAAPKQHIADLLSDILEDKQDRRRATYQRILVQMIEVLPQINVNYVLRSMGDHIEEMRFKAIILEAAEKIDAQGHNGIREAKNLFQNFLRLNDFTTKRRHDCTMERRHDFTTLRLDDFTTKRRHDGTKARLYDWTTLRLHEGTMARLYDWTTLRLND